MITTTLTLLAICTVSGLMVAPSPANAATSKEQICEGISATGGSCDPQAASLTIDNVLRIALNTLSFIAGLIGVIMVIIGGIKYITSQGDASSINSAKNTILYALVGIVVAVVAQFLVRFVLSSTQKAAETSVKPNTANTTHAPDAGQ